MSIDIDRIYSPHFLKDTHFWMSETFHGKKDFVCMIILDYLVDPVQSQGSLQVE